MLYQLKYTNEYGQVIKFGGDVYGFVDTHTPNVPADSYHLNKFEGFGDVGADIQLQKAPHQDGSTHIDTVLEERPIFIEFTLHTTNFSDLSAMRKYISKVFSPRINGTLEMKYGSETYVIDCVSEHVPKFSDSGLDVLGHLQIGAINLIAPEPYWRSPTVTAEPAFEPLFEFPSDEYWDTDDDGDMFFEMGLQRNERIIENDSDAPAPLKVDFYGPADSPIIENLTTGEFIKINKRLEENETLKIDTTDGIKSVIYVDVDGNETNVFHWIDLDSTFFKLVIGENDITCHCAVSNNQRDFDIYYSKLYNAV